MNKQVILGGIAIAVLGAGAPLFAAPTPDYNWTGFYAGLNAGGASGRSDLKTSVASDGYFDQSTSVPSVDSHGSQTVSPSGFIGGIQAGYNQQSGHVVYGIEGDFDALDLSGSKSISAVYPDYAPSSYIINQSVKTNWLVTVRPKIGWAQDRYLVYATGGLAYTQLQYHGSFNDNYNGDNDPDTTSFADGAFESASKTESEAGYVLGLGAGYALQNNWSVSAEYLYVDFGRISTSGTLTTSVYPGDSAILNHSANLSSNIFRVALNYKF